MNRKIHDGSDRAIYIEKALRHIGVAGINIRPLFKRDTWKGEWPTMFMAIAAKRGLIQVLEWALDEGCPELQDPSNNTCYMAASYGQIDALAWLVDHGAKFNSGVAEGAMIGGHLFTLQWLIAKGCPIRLDMISVSAARKGRIEVLNWLKDTYGRQYVTPSVCWEAAYEGRFLTVKWYVKFGFPLNTKMMNYAADESAGHLNIMKFLYENGCPIDDSVLQNAHPRVVEWCNQILQQQKIGRPGSPSLTSFGSLNSLNSLLPTISGSGL